MLAARPAISCRLRQSRDATEGRGSTAGRSHLAYLGGSRNADAGAEKQAAAIARQRGLKAARLEAILQEIAAGFTDPAFDIGIVASRLRLSVRYIQDLLQGTGSSFSDRVLELRLVHSCELLARAAISGARSAISPTPPGSTTFATSTAASDGVSA